MNSDNDSETSLELLRSGLNDSKCIYLDTDSSKPQTCIARPRVPAVLSKEVEIICLDSDSDTEQDDVPVSDIGKAKFTQESLQISPSSSKHAINAKSTENHVQNNQNVSEESQHQTSTSENIPSTQQLDDVAEQQAHLHSQNSLRSLENLEVGVKSTKSSGRLKRGEAEKEAARVQREATQAAKRAAKEVERETKRRLREEAQASKKQAQEQAKADKRRRVERERVMRGVYALEELTAILHPTLLSTQGPSCCHLATTLQSRLEEVGMSHCVHPLPVPHSITFLRHPPTSSQQARDQAISSLKVNLNECVPYVLLVLDNPTFMRSLDNGRQALSALLNEARSAHKDATLCLLIIGFHHHSCESAVTAAAAWLCTHPSGVRHCFAFDHHQGAEHVVAVAQAVAKLPYWPEEGYLTIFATTNSKLKRLTSTSNHQDCSEGENEESQLVAASQGSRGSAGGGSDSSAQRRKQVAPNAKETWLHALMKVSHCAEADARSIISVYPTPASLFDAYCNPGLTPMEGAKMLADLKRDPGRSTGVGATTTRRLGPALSERIYKIFSHNADPTMALL